MPLHLLVVIAADRHAVAINVLQQLRPQALKLGLAKCLPAVIGRELVHAGLSLRHALVCNG